jgi:hypothetical protein
MDLAHLVRDAGVEEDPFGGRGLAGINVRTDADVAIPFDGRCSGHLVFGNAHAGTSNPLRALPSCLFEVS